MFSRLLVPLDGSPLAETALPAAWFLVKTFKASVTLLHLVERNAPAEVHHERHLRSAEEAQTYLADVRQRAFPKTAPVECHVHTAEISDVPRSIGEHAAEMKSDLIVMCTHGRGAARRWLFGSIAQQVIASSGTPLLLIPPQPDQSVIAFQCDRLVVPLDGNPEHEPGLRAAVKLARACQAAIHLLLVIPRLEQLKSERAAAGKLLPLTMTALLDMSEADAEAYLHTHLQELQTAGLAASAEVARGDAALAIVDAVRRTQASLIAMGTHGKTGLDAVWSDSLTPTLANRSPVPILLVRV